MFKTLKTGISFARIKYQKFLSFYVKNIFTLNR